MCACGLHPESPSPPPSTASPLFSRFISAFMVFFGDVFPIWDVHLMTEQGRGRRWDTGRGGGMMRVQARSLHNLFPLLSPTVPCKAPSEQGCLILVSLDPDDAYVSASVCVCVIYCEYGRPPVKVVIISVLLSFPCPRCPVSSCFFQCIGPYLVSLPNNRFIRWLEQALIVR